MTDGSLSEGSVSESSADDEGEHGGRNDDDNRIPDAAALRKPPEVLEQWQSADDVALLIRPLFSDDIGRQLRFLETLSSNSRYERLLGHRSTLRPGELRQLVRFDVRREVALLASVGAGEDEEIIGVARLHNTGEGSCEYAIVVGDAWQGKGVGARLLTRLLDVARSAGVVEVIGTTHSSNEAMKQLARKVGFVLGPEPEDASLTRLTCLL
jgi:acetyltransferase